MNSLACSIIALGATAVGLACGLFLTGCGTPVRGQPFDPAAPTFPTIQGDSLNNRPFIFPEGLDAPYAVLMVAFLREQQEDVNTWLDTARQVAADHANVEYYELPVISSGFTLIRGFVDGGMRSGLPQFAVRERTVTVYTDVEKFRELAGIDSPRQIWTGLVDRQGRVYWSARGPSTPEALAQLKDAARQLAAPAAP